MEKIKKQVLIYCIFNFVNRFMVYLPIFVLFLYKKGLNQTQVMILMSAYNLAIIVSELPTGVVADTFSRKVSVILGGLIQGISMLLMVPLTSYYSLVFLEVIFGIGMTFQSGAMSAMMYDFLKENKSENLYAKVEGKRWATVFISQGLASIIGGQLAENNMDLTIIITGGAFIVSSIFLLLFKEVKTNSVISDYRMHVLSTGKKIIKSNEIAVMLFVIVITNTLVQTTIWLYQPYYRDIGISVSTYGIAYFMMNSVSALGGIISSKANLNQKTSIHIYMLGNTILLLVMGACHSLVGVILPALIFFVNGLVNPWIQQFWEEKIDNEERATASSMVSVVSSVAFALLAIPLGYISDLYGVNITFIVASAVGCFSYIVVMLLGVRREKNEIHS